tara:strand:+ start:172 stop:573 length:402 start_codon:yes stop_codon:yes gene_type:complete
MNFEDLLISLERNIDDALRCSEDFKIWEDLDAKLSFIQRSMTMSILDAPVSHLASDWGRSTSLWARVYGLSQLERTEHNRRVIHRSQKIWEEVVELVECAFEVHSSMKARGLASPVPCIDRLMNTPSPTKQVK